MKLRAGFFAGFIVGYYLGAQAGRERYQQLNKLIGRISRSGPVDMAADKAKTVVDLGYEKAKEGVSHKFKHDSPDANGNLQSEMITP